MATSGVKVLMIGKRFSLPYEVTYLENLNGLFSTIAQFNPDVILTSKFIPGQLNNVGYSLRKKWIHVDENSDDASVIRAVESCYVHNLHHKGQYEDKHPLVSVYGGTYNTGDFLRDTYQSLKDQTYPNWEYVVIDDCSSDKTWDRLCELASEDVRVRAFRSARGLRKIGAVKDLATRMAKGEFLVELDHDDMLVDTALDEIKKAFMENPEVGFVYSNCSNFFENGTFHRFGKDGFWEKYYRETEYRGKLWLECVNPDIYDRFGPDFRQQFGWFLTVGPNHVRAYRAKTLFELGGYNPNLPVADDWDMFARFFLYSKCLHVDKMLYLYRFLDNWQNTTFKRNQSIQDHMEHGRAFYAEEFKKFNEKRLAGEQKTPAVVPPKENTLLTVTIPALVERMREGVIPVMADLFDQAKGKPVEIKVLLDNRKVTLSEKRNQAIANAKGKFITFVDDDDKVEPDYIDKLLEAIRDNHDADCIVFDVMVHGFRKEPKVCKYGKDLTHKEDPTAFYRWPNHVMAFRTEISQRYKYEVSRSGLDEDTRWASRAKQDIGKEVRIDKVLYHYMYDPKTTTQIKPRLQALMELFPGPKGCPVGEPGEKGEPGRSYGAADMSVIVLEAVPTELTVKCLRSVRKYAPKAEVILVANGCEPMEEAVKLADKMVRLPANIRFAAGMNRGVMEATKPLVCILNNDAEFVDGTPERLAAAVQDSFQIVAPYSNRAKPPQGDVPQDRVPPSDVPVPMVVGLCLVCPTDLYRELGGFDARLDTWEDDDFCERARVLGYRCKVVGGTYVAHERHATFKALGEDVQAIMEKNGAIFKKKHPVIRVVAIAKNEEKCIQGFFEQFAGVTTDWCLLDTGSTDKTVQIAKAMGVNVATGGLKDFASARNEALDLFSKGADWIVMFDPDERLDEAAIRNLKELVFRTEFDIFLAPLQAVNKDGSRQTFVPKPFLFRAKPEIRWVFRVHEKLIGSTKQAVVKNAMIDHLIVLHEDGRRQSASGMYDALMREEPYFTDPAYKAEMLKKWPILDYDRMDDERLAKIVAGPLVSVVIPTFQRPELLEKAVKSALAQDYVNLEVIVVGDCDPTLALRPADRLRVLNLSKNHGAGGAVPRNVALMMAAGELIAYLDDDNEWLPDHVSSVVGALVGAEASYAFSSMSVDGKDLGFTEPKKFGIDTSCVVHRKALIRQFGWWKDRVEGGYAHDWEFFSRWAASGVKWACTKKPTLLYNADSSGQKEFLLSLAAAENNTGKWPYKDDTEQYPYGDETTYKLAAEFLDGHGDVEDWGCGVAWAKRFFQKSKYVGVDGTRSKWADVVGDLRLVQSRPDCLLMRHVLEHNFDWRAILKNALASFQKRMVLVLFTPFEETTKVLANNNIGVPDLALPKKELLELFGGVGWKEQSLKTNTQYGAETVFFLERVAAPVEV